MTQEAIYKTPFGYHIDLDKIIAIGDAEFLDKMGSGGWFVTFSIDVQLRDLPMTYTRRVVEDVEAIYQQRYHLRLTDGTTIHEGDVHRFEKDPQKILAVANLQKQIDELISVWKARKS